MFGKGNTMKKLIALLAIIIFCMAGCTSLKYGDARYLRIGDQKLDEVSITKTADGDITATLKGQASQADALVEAIKKIPMPAE